MKKSYILLAIVVMMTITGCDFFRKLAGRPTSAEIEVKRQEMVADLEAKAARQKAIEDSLALVARNEADSIEACRYIQENKIRIYTAASLGGIAYDEYEEMVVDPPLDVTFDGGNYRVIVGSFKEKRNADRKRTEIGMVRDEFWAHHVVFRNGMIAVATEPHDQIQGAVSGIHSLKGCGVCPEDVWILKIK